MSPAKFKEYIDNPVNLTKADEADLKELLQEFPYFNAGQVMLSKIYKNEENFRFERQLKLAAMYAGDRTKLFDYLNTAPEVKPEEIIIETKPEPVKVEVKEEVKEVRKAEVIEEEVVEKKVMEETPKPLTRFTLATDEEVTQAEEEISEPVNVNTSLHIKPDIEVAEEPIAEVIKEEIVKEEEPKEEVEEIVTEPEAIAETEQEHKPVSFYDWLALKGDREEKQKEVEQKAEVEPEKKVDINSIIGKFLTEQPTISRPKAEFYSPNDMAKRSEEDNNNIVSESLAKLYVKQHLYTKAIAVYEKLCLLIPEKSETFAHQIKTIKQQHNID